MRVSRATPQVPQQVAQRLVYLRSSVDGTLLRTASLNGTSYLVVPCVSKLGNNVEWPVNAPYPELVPAEVLSLAAHMRNNRPVVMGHPQDDTGEYVSANTPEILATYAFGHVFNARFDSGSNKMLCDLWLDPARAQAIGADAESVVARLQAGQMVEVSEGNYVAVDETPGVWIDGREYGAKWTLCFPDHVATLREDEVGACSIEDGCGALRASQGFESMPSLRVASGFRISALSQARRPNYTGTETSTWTRPSFADYVRYLYNGDSAPGSVSQCSMDLKRAIAAHTLLGDPEASNFGDLSAVPVVNPATGYLNESALRAVLSGRGLSGLSDSAVNSAQEMCRRLLASEFSANLEAASSGPDNSTVKETTMDKKPNLLKRLFGSITALPHSIRDAMSNNLLRGRLEEAISKIEPGLYRVEDEDPDARTVVYMTRVIYDTYDYRAESFWWQRTYEMDSAGSVTLNDDRQAVEPAMVWKPIEPGTGTESAVSPEMSTAESGSPGCGCQSQTQTDTTEADTGGEIMNRSAIIARLSALPQFAPMAAALNSMDDQALQGLDQAFPPAETGEETRMVQPENVAIVGAASDTNSVSISREEHAELQAYRAAQAERKNMLVTSLAASQAAFSAQDLQAMDLGQLEKLAQLPGIGINAAIGSSTFVVPPVSGSGSASGQRVSRKLPDSWGLEAARNKSGTGAAN